MSAWAVRTGAPELRLSLRSQRAPKRAPQQAGHADGVDGRNHDVEDAGNEESAAVLGQGRDPKAQHDEKGHEADRVDRCQLPTPRNAVAKEKPNQQGDQQKKARGRKERNENISGGRGEASDKVAQDQAGRGATAKIGRLQPRLLSDDLAAKIGSEPFQGLFGVGLARVELEDAVEIVARRATAAKLVIKVGTVAVGHHRFRVELDRLGIVGEPKDRRTFSSP